MHMCASIRNRAVQIQIMPKCRNKKEQKRDVLQSFVAVIRNTLHNVDPVGGCTRNWSIEAVLNTVIEPTRVEVLEILTERSITLIQKMYENHLISNKNELKKEISNANTSNRISAHDFHSPQTKSTDPFQTCADSCTSHDHSYSMSHLFLHFVTPVSMLFPLILSSDL